MANLKTATFLLILSHLTLIKSALSNQESGVSATFPPVVSLGKNGQFCARFFNINELKSDISLSVTSYDVNVFPDITMVLPHRTKLICFDIEISENGVLEGQTSTLHVSCQTLNGVFKFEQDKSFKIVARDQDPVFSSNDEIDIKAIYNAGLTARINSPVNKVNLQDHVNMFEQCRDFCKRNEVAQIGRANMLDQMLDQNLESDLWTISCRRNNCEQAFEFSIEERCYGKKQCKSIFLDAHFPKCAKCSSQLLDVKNQETIDGVNYLICDSEDSLQVKGCNFYCRVNYQPRSQCIRENGIPVCKCIESPLGSTSTSNIPNHTNRLILPFMDNFSFPKKKPAPPPAPLQSEVYAPFRSSRSENPLLKATLSGHLNKVLALVSLQNGDLASASADKSIRVWDRRDGSLKVVMEGHKDSVTALLLLKNGELASASADKTIRIWNMNNYTTRLVMEGHFGAINRLINLPKDEIGSTSSDQTIKIWDVRNLRPRPHTFEGHSADVVALVLLQNGDLASGSWDNSIKLWSLAEKFSRATLIGHTDKIRALVLLPNGDLASGSSDSTIRIWDTLAYLEKRVLRGHKEGVWSLVVLGDGQLASASADATIKIWNPNEGRLIKTLDGHTNQVTLLTILPSGDLASASNDRSIKIWNPGYSSPLKQTLTSHNDSISCMAVLESGDLASGSWDRTVKVWNITGSSGNGW